MDKESIRAQMSLQRKNMDADEAIRNSALICDRIIKTSYYRNSMSVFSYMSFENEVNTGPIIARALSDGKSVCIPDRLGSSEMRAVSYPDDPGDLVECWHGILSVSKEKCREIDPDLIDLCLIPGLAFGRDLTRIGFGAGYYDAFLRSLRPDCVKVGLCHSFQVTDTLPFEPGRDVKMDLVITELGIIK